MVLHNFWANTDVKSIKLINYNEHTDPVIKKQLHDERKQCKNKKSIRLKRH